VYIWSNIYPLRIAVIPRSQQDGTAARSSQLAIVVSSKGFPVSVSFSFVPDEGGARPCRSFPAEVLFGPQWRTLLAVNSSMIYFEMVYGDTLLEGVSGWHAHVCKGSFFTDLEQMA
jgi:hypothetical protein